MHLKHIKKANEIYACIKKKAQHANHSMYTIDTFQGSVTEILYTRIYTTFSTPQGDLHPPPSLHIPRGNLQGQGCIQNRS